MCSMRSWHCAQAIITFALSLHPCMQVANLSAWQRLPGQTASTPQWCASMALSAALNVHLLTPAGM